MLSLNPVPPPELFTGEMLKAELSTQKWHRNMTATKDANFKGVLNEVLDFVLLTCHF